jgi:hypothetical protein
MVYEIQSELDFLLGHGIGLGIGYGMDQEVRELKFDSELERLVDVVEG